jgi:hypothetical protein
MINLKKFFESPFEKLYLGKDKLYKFYDDHVSRLKAAVANGEPFNALLIASLVLLANLKKSLGGHASKLAQKEMLTMTVDNVVELFKKTVRLHEASILVKFPKEHPVYQEFFPHGKSEYTSATKASIGKLMLQIINAIENHKTDLGQPLLDEFTGLQTLYDNSRDEQIQKKEDTETERANWDTNLAAMEDQAFQNLLSIALIHRNHPEKIKMFFDQSLLVLKKHNKEDEEILPYILSVLANTTKAANISFSVDDSLEITNNGEKSVFYYGAVTADSICPPAATELLPGESKIVSGEILGAPVNKYILFTNKDATTEAEVEISMLIK